MLPMVFETDAVRLRSSKFSCMPAREKSSPAEDSLDSGRSINWLHAQNADLGMGCQVDVLQPKMTSTVQGEITYTGLNDCD